MKLTTVHPNAAAEVAEAAEYYERHSTALGLDLLGEVDQALSHISTNSEACQLIGR